MKNLSDMKNLEMLRGAMYLPKMVGKNNGHAIYLTSDNFVNNKNLLVANDFKNMNLYKSYFIDNIYKFDLFNININKILKTNKYLELIKQDTDISKTYKKINMYKNSNVFIDTYFYHKIFIKGIESMKDIRSLYENIEDKETFFDSVEEYLNEEMHIGEDEDRDNMLLLEKFVGKKVLDEYWHLMHTIWSKYDHGFATNTILYNVSDWKDDYSSPTTFSVNNARTPIAIIVATMKTDLERFKALPFQFVIVSKNIKVRIIPSECTETSADELKIILRKMDTSTISNMTVSKTDTTTNVSDLETTTGIEDLVLDVADKVDNKVHDNFGRAIVQSFTGEILQKEITDIIDDTAEGITKELEDDSADADMDEIEAKTEEVLNSNPAFLKALESLKSESVTGAMSAQNTKRNKLLMDRQMDLKINKSGMSIKQILDEGKSKQLKSKKIRSNTLNTEMTDLKFANFSRQYNSDLLDKDTIAILNFFKDKRIPVYILDIQKEDTSDNFSKKYTYTVKMESGDRKRHTLKFDFPKFIDDSYMYLNGNKKNILNQLLLKPVSKTGPDTVQLCSNYNKIFLTRVGTKLSPKIEKFKKTLISDSMKLPKSKLSYTTGDNRSANSDFKTTIEYDELASYLDNVVVNGMKIYFNQNSIREDISVKKLKLVENDFMLPIGIIGSNVLYLNTDTNNVETGKCDESMVDYLVSEIDKVSPEFSSAVQKTTVGKKFMYTQATIMKKHIPIILILSYLEGISEVLKKAEIKYTFSDTRPKVGLNGMVFKFADGYLVCDEDRQPLSNSLLLNGLSLLPTEEFNFEDFEKKETYLNIFADLYGNRMILNAFENFYDLFIDPITLEVLKDLNLPIDFVSLVIYGNKLLEDNQFVKENNLSHYRIRNNELVNGFLYKALATAYSGYRSSSANRNPIPFSIPKDKVLKDIIMSNIVEDTSTLNPVLEAEKDRATTFKGLSGLNQQRAYTEEKRSYDKSMKGILAISSPPTGSVGMVRQLALDANILSPRGYLQITDDNHMDNLNSANMFSPSELLTPTCAQRDDAQRVAMTSTQSKHIVPVKKGHKLLLTNGADDVLAHIISDDFAFKAKEDGTVVEINEKANIIIIKYKSGSYDVIETDSKVFKNGGGGFYINNKLTPHVKLNQKVKQDDILAVNEQFFDGSNVDEDVTFRSGSLAKMAISSSYFTYEDACAITDSLSNDMTTQITMKKEVILGKNSNIDFIVKKGDIVEVGSPLLVFDESYDDEGLNKMLANMSKQDGDDFRNLSKVPVKSKYSGVIEDIKVYYTIDKSEMSKSMANTINQINKITNDKKRTIEKYTSVNNTNIMLEPTDKVETQYGKVKGVEIGDGIMIEFYINYEDKMGVGDKLTFFTALKGIVSEVIDKGQEPYSEYRPDEEVSAFISPVSYYARMTGSLPINMFTNKLLIELKRQCVDIYEE